MVKVGMCMEDMRDHQTQFLHFTQNLFMGPTWIDHDCLFRYRISKDRAIATEGWNGKGFSN